jgi:hypothetical protein
MDVKRANEGDVRSPYLGHNDYFIAWKVELLDSLAEDDFGEPIRINLSV